jgi:hypothetical protein
MDEDEIRRREEAWQRSHEALARIDAALADSQSRGVAPSAGYQRTATGWPIAPDPPAAQPIQPRPERAAKAPRRDWAAERAWIEDIWDQKIAKYDESLIEGMGEVIGRERKDQRLAREALAEEIGRDVGALQKRVAELESAIAQLRAGNDERLTAAVDRMNALLDRIDKTGRETRKLDDIDLRMSADG